MPLTCSEWLFRMGFSVAAGLISFLELNSQPLYFKEIINILRKTDDSEGYQKH